MRRIGTQLKLTAEERSELLADLAYWHVQVSDDRVLAKRDDYCRAFDCIWPNQNPKGVKLDTAEQKAWPFEGASDQRIRWGEKIYLDYLALVVVAIETCEVEISCGGDAASLEKARCLKLLLKSLMQQLGAKGSAEVQAMLRYMLCDSPAVGALDVAWKRRRTMGVVELDADALEAEYAAYAAANGAAETDAAINFRVGLDQQDPNAWESVRNWLVAVRKIGEGEVDEVIAALAEDGECETVCVVDENEGPEIKALRYGDDFCVPKLTDDFDYASPMFRGEWMTEAQLREKVSDDDWDEDWVEETLQHRGLELFTEMGTYPIEDVKDLVNVVWCYTAETNDRGETSRYVSVLSHAEGSAFGKRLVKTRRGKWNIAFFRREVRSSGILDARGLAEISAAPQGAAKLVRDMAANNAIVGSLPPVKAKGARVRNVLLEPFAVINMGQSDDVGFMQPPAFPAAADKQEEKIKNDLLEYTGVSNGQTDVTDRRRAFVFWFLQQWRDFLVLLLEVAQDNASDEFVLRATETQDVKGVKAQGIAGNFLITLKLDPTNLDNEKLIEKMNATSQFLQAMDRKGVVDTEPVVKKCFSMMYPELADKAFKSADRMTQDDIADEKRNFALIKAGVMPDMNTDGGWNYEARLQFWQQLQQENPDAIAEMSPTSQDMMNRWIAALQQQMTQFGENAEIGKTGVQGVGAE